MVVYMLSSQVYLDRLEYNYCYKNILVINREPKPGTPLATMVRRIANPPLSHFDKFDSNRKSCIYAFIKDGKILEDKDIPDLFSFLLENEYEIDTKLTKMMNQSTIHNQVNKLLCFIKEN